MEKANIPKVRFDKFNDDWEQHKWSDTVDISTEMVDPTSGEYDEMPHIAPGNIESFTGRILDNVKSVKEEQLISGKFRFRPGDVVYGKINPQLGKYFYARVNGLTSADAYVFNGKNGVTQKFLFSLLQTEDFFKYSVSVSKRSGMPKINRDELNAYSFLAPKEEEQDKIGIFLLDLDNLITLHQRKYEKLQMIKKSMLEKMFPQNGEKKPEIRFEGFTDDWEQRKLGEMGSTFTGLSGKTKEDFGHGEAKFITYMNVFSNPVANLEMTESVEIDTKQNSVKKGDVFFTTSSETSEDVGMSCVMPENKENIYLNSFCFGYRPTEKFDLDYLAYVLRTASFRKEMTFLAQGISRYNISKNKVMEVSIPVPNLEEQAMIGGYFSNLDHLITLHQRKLEKLRNIKKSMLEKMFV